VSSLARALDVGAGEQLLDEVAPQPELRLGDAAKMRQLQREHGGRVLEHDVVAARLLPTEGDDSLVLVAGPSEDQQPAAISHRLAGLAKPAQKSLTAVRRILGIRVGRAQSGRGNQVAVAILDRDRPPGELVHGERDPVLTFARDRDTGEAVVDREAALCQRHGARRFVGRTFQRQVGGLQPLGGEPVLGVKSGVGERGRGLLDENADEELPMVVRLGVGRDHEVAGDSTEADERVGPSPSGVEEFDPVADSTERLQLPLQVRRGLACAYAIPFPPAAVELDGLGPKRPERRDRGDRQADDLVLVGDAGHHYRQREQRPEGRQVLAQLAGVRQAHPQSQ
jgi:hypothetical protein